MITRQISVDQHTVWIEVYDSRLDSFYADNPANARLLSNGIVTARCSVSHGAVVWRKCMQTTMDLLRCSRARGEVLRMMAIQTVKEMEQAS